MDAVAAAAEVARHKDHVGCYPEIHLVSSSKQFGLTELKLSITQACELV
jgi:hypothetical protein